MDQYSDKVKKRIDKLTYKIREAEREKEAGNEIILEVVNNNRLKFRQKGIDPTKNAEITKQGKKTTIRYNAERYTPRPHGTRSASPLNRRSFR